MKNRFLLLVLLMSVSASALQARDLIAEAEDVYRILSPRDAEKIPVTLRLADLLFDAAIEIDGDGKATAEDSRKADQYRSRSEALYKEVLPRLTPAQALKVKFQMARLYSFKAQMTAATQLWQQIVETTDGDKRLRRESALHWAEQLELSNENASIRRASGLYGQALPWADKDSLRSYILYRQSWAQYRLGQADTASASILKAIALTSEKERDEWLRDYILFLSRDEKQALAQIAQVEAIEKQYGRKGHLAQLADAYMAADRKVDYAATLEYLNKTEPNLERAVSILDASHDSSTISQIETRLQNIENLKRSGVRFESPEVEKKSKDKLFRLVHLWDGNRRAGKKGYSELLADGVATMILLFPRADETSQAISGWLAAHPNPSLQRPQVDRWIGLARESGFGALEIRLTQNKLELARQSKDWATVVEVSKALETLTANQARPVRYQRAKALYELKKYGEALPIFLSLAEEPTKEKDDFRRLSQDLALDILAIQKDYPQITALTSKWKSDAGRSVEMASIGEKAKFEAAVAAQDAKSLETFTQFCLEKKFTPTSCDNARSLAGKQRNQGVLITVLKAQGDEKELTQQLELAGRFGESARLLEKSLKLDDRMAWLKVALLFELQGELRERDRVLTQLARQLTKSGKLSENEQSLLYLTFKDAGIIDEKSLQLPWSEPLKAKIASDLFDVKPTATTQALLSKHCGPAGRGWMKLHLQSMKDINAKQAKIQFTGSASKSKFEQRVALLKSLGQEANCFKQGATPDLSKAAMTKVAEAYSEFAEKIRATPIPEGLDEDTQKQVEAQIDTMASPFEKQSEQWHATADQVQDAVEVAAGWNFDLPVASEATSKLAFDWQPYLNDIQKDPFQRQNFEQLKAHFELKGRERLAAYVKGRLQDMETGVQQ